MKLLQTSSPRNKDEFNSSIDSKSFDKNDNRGNFVPQYKTKEMDRNDIKEKLKTKIKNGNELFKSNDSVGWENVYADFFSNILTTNLINSKELELRINSVLNKYDVKKNKLIKHESEEYKKTLSNRKEVFFMDSIISKYAHYTKDFNEHSNKSLTKRINKVITINSLNKRISTKNVNSGLSKLPSKNLNPVGQDLRRTVGYRNEALKKSKTLLSENNKNSTNNIIENLSFDKSLNFEIKNESETGHQSDLKMFLCNIKNLEKSSYGISNKENIDNIKNGIKSYEKELMKSQKIFSIPKLKKFKHLFVFEDTRDGIKLSKAVRKFNDKEQLGTYKKKIDFLIYKQMTLGKNHI